MNYLRNALITTMHGLGCALLCACFASESPKLPEGEAAPATASLAARAQLRSRIDDVSALKLGTDARPAQRPLDLASFGSRVLGEPLSVVVAASGSSGALQKGAIEQGSGSSQAGSSANVPQGFTASFEATVGTKEVRVNVRTRQLEVSDQRGYAVDDDSSVVDDAVLLQQSRDLLGALGIDLAEAELHVKHLGVEGGERKSGTRLGGKVFAMRNIDGIPVAGNRTVFSYANDGSLRNVRGTWPSVDLARSTLRTALDRDQVVERALDALEAAGERPDKQVPIDVETFFQVVEAGDLHVLRLRGAARTRAIGPNGTPGRGVRFEFDL